jgi:hypothetical protein
MNSRRPAKASETQGLSLKDNPAAITGLVLSVVQLVAHGTWISLVTWLASSGQAEQLDAESPAAWAVVILLSVSTILTFVALYVCLFRGLRRSPRTLAVIGFALSFFVGVFAFAVVTLSFLRFLAG